MIVFTKGSGNTIYLPRLDNEWNILSCLWAIFWTASGVMNVVNKKALRRKWIPVVKSPSLWTLWKTEKAKGFPSFFFFHGEKNITSNREYNHPAVLFWTVSSFVVLCMLNSSQLTQPEETNYEITIENRMQYSTQKLNCMNTFANAKH